MCNKHIREVQMLYPIIVEDIERAKQWQWKLFIQILVGQAAICSLTALLPNKSLIANLLIALSIGITWLGILEINKTEEVLNKARERNLSYRETFEAETKTLLGEPSINGKQKFKPFMWIILASACFLTLIVICTRLSCTWPC